MKPTPYELAKIVFNTEPSPVSFWRFLLDCIESPTIHVFNTPSFFIAIEMCVLPKRFYTWPDPQQYYHVHLASGDYREAARFCLQNLPWLPHIGWERYNKFRLHSTRHVLDRLLPDEPTLQRPRIRVQSQDAPPTITYGNS